MGKVMKKATVYELAAAAVFAALLSVLAPLTIPIGPIPVTLATLILYLSIYVLPTRSALSSCAVYLLLGAFGLPVFTGYAGGIAKIAAQHDIPCQVSLEKRMACGLGACLSCVCDTANGERKKICKDGPVFWAQDVFFEK